MKKKLQYTIIVTLLATIYATRVFAGGVTAGIYTGINSNLLQFNSSISSSQVKLGDYVRNDNITKPGNSSIESTSSSIVGIPIGVNIRYLEHFYLIKLGLAYYFGVGGYNEIQTDKLATARTIIEDVSIRVFQMPLTFAFNIRNDGYTRFYAGAGPTLYFGSAQVTHDNGDLGSENGQQVKTTADIDVFSGWTLGAHLTIGAEVSLSSSTSLGIEFVMNFGSKSPVSDDSDSITTADKANIQQTELVNAPDVLGVYNNATDNRTVAYDYNQPSGLNFSGFQVIFSVNYFLGIL